MVDYLECYPRDGDILVSESLEHHIKEFHVVLSEGSCHLLGIELKNELIHTLPHNLLDVSASFLEDTPLQDESRRLHYVISLPDGLDLDLCGRCLLILLELLLVLLLGFKLDLELREVPLLREEALVEVEADEGEAIPHQSVCAA